MKLEQILDDIRSDRVKKVIFDSDTYNEMDDQYAIAYALGCPKMEVIALNAVLFHNPRSESPADGMEKSYEEIFRVMEVTHTTGRCPVFRGCPVPISTMPDFAPVDSPATQFIIKTAMESDEIIYILATGAITNVTSAILMEPAIKEKICVIWLGCNCLGAEHTFEFNLVQDLKAGQILLNSGVPLVLLPAFGEPGYGTQELKARKSDFQVMTGDSDACVFFRDTLPAEFDHEQFSYSNTPGVWERIIWDVAAPAVLSVPDAFRFSVIPAPVITDDLHLVTDSTRHKIIYMETLDPRMIFPDTFTCIGSL